MKAIFYSIAAMSFVFASGCVHRTVTEQPGYINPSTGEPYETSSAYTKVVEDKTVWFWQKDFRNPKK